MPLSKFVGPPLSELGYDPQPLSNDDRERQPLPRGGEPVDEKSLRSALATLYPGMGRDEWIRVVAGIGAANIIGGDDGAIRERLALEWSRGDLHGSLVPANYSGEDAVLTVLATMPPTEGGIGVGTVFALAKAAGWTGNPHSDGKTAFADWKDVSVKAPATALPRLRTLDDAEQAELPEYRDRRDWFIKAPSYFIWHGLKGTGKSLAALAFMMELVEDGNRVLYLCAEGYQVMEALRLPAAVEIAIARGVKREYIKTNFRMVKGVPRPNDKEFLDHLDKLAREFKPDFIFLDTTSEMTAGSDLNATETGGALGICLRGIAERTGSSVIGVAHSNEQGQLFGSKVSTFNADGVFHFTSDFDKGEATLAPQTIPDAMGKLEPVGFKYSTRPVRDMRAPAYTLAAGPAKVRAEVPPEAKTFREIAISAMKLTDMKEPDHNKVTKLLRTQSSSSKPSNIARKMEAATRRKGYARNGKVPLWLKCSMPRERTAPMAPIFR
jgi:hypothetical protein